MGIQQDAGEILVYIYQQYTTPDFRLLSLSNEKLLEETKWDEGKLERAIDYLEDRGILETLKFIGGRFLIKKLYPEGIDIVENADKFQGVFGFTINLGLVQFSWKSK